MKARAKQQAASMAMAASRKTSTFCFQDAMEKTWFHTNILFAPSPGFKIPDDYSEPLPRKPAGFKEKRPTRLNVAIAAPPPCLGGSREPSSCPSFSRRKRAMKQLRNRKSLTSTRRKYELENYEVRGFMDLGFVFDEEELSAEIVSMIPGLQRLGREEEGEEEEEGVETVERPYLSEAWLAKREDELRLPSLLLPSWSPSGGDDVKRELRFWAREVASAVHHGFSS